MKAPVEIRDSLKYADYLKEAINSLKVAENKKKIDSIENRLRNYLKKFSADHPNLACYSEIKSIAKQFDDALSETREKVQRIQQQNERRERYEKRLLTEARLERIARVAQEEKASSEGSGLPEEKTNQPEEAHSEGTDSHDDEIGQEEAPSEETGLGEDEANQEEASSEEVGSHDDEAGQDATHSDGVGLYEDGIVHQENFLDRVPCSSPILLVYGKTQQASVEANEKKKREARLAEKDQRLKLELEARLESRRKARLAAKDQILKLALDKRRDEQRKARHQPK